MLVEFLHRRQQLFDLSPLEVAGIHLPPDLFAVAGD